MSNHDDDFAFEPIPGVPSKLPAGEHIVWSGSPEKWQLGHRVFCTKWIVALAVVLAVSSVFSGINHGASAGRIALTVVMLLMVGGMIVGFFAVLGWLVATNTIYTITNKRLIIRHGVTMPMAVNIPFTKIAKADANVRRDGSADISMSLMDGSHVSIFAVWPHNRPWNLQGAAPALRSVPDGARVAKLVSDTLLAHAEAELAATTELHQPVQSRPKLVRTRERYTPMAPGITSAGGMRAAGP